MVKKDVDVRLHGRIPPIRVGEIEVPPSCGKSILRSRELLGTDGRLLIDHNGRWYVLRSLPGGRLILTGWNERAFRPTTGNRSVLR